MDSTQCIQFQKEGQGKEKGTDGQQHGGGMAETEKRTRDGIRYNEQTFTFGQDKML